MAHVQTVSVFAEFVPSVTILNSELAQNPAAGNALALGVFYSGAYTETISDSYSSHNTYVAFSSNPQIISGFIWSEAFYSENITGGANPSYKCSSSNAGDIIAFYVSEFSGRATTGQPDAQGSNQNSSGSATATGPALTCAANDDVWMMGCIPQGHTTVTATAGSGYAIPANGNLMTDYNCSAVEYQNAVSSGTVTPTMTWNSSQLYTTFAIAFAVSGGGGGPTVHTLMSMGMGN